MLLQKVSSTMPACFSRQRGLEICSPGPQFALHSSQSRKFHENSGLRGLFSLTPNEYLTVTFSFGRIYSGNKLTNLGWQNFIPSTRGRNYFSIVERSVFNEKNEKKRSRGGGWRATQWKEKWVLWKEGKFCNILINNADWKLKIFSEIYPEILLYGICEEFYECDLCWKLL